MTDTTRIWVDVGGTFTDVVLVSDGDLFTVKVPSTADHVLNDPFEGGTHLPDLTMVSPLCDENEIIGYAASRAHHADIGGGTPESMPAGTREIYSEGLRLPPVRLKYNGEINEDVFYVLLANVRNPTERRADLRAQLAANEQARTAHEAKTCSMTPPFRRRRRATFPQERQ